MFNISSYSKFCSTRYRFKLSTWETIFLLRNNALAKNTHRQKFRSNLSKNANTYGIILLGFELCFPF